MTALLQQIRAAQLTARKAKNTIEATLLTTLIGEAVALGKNKGNREPTDAEVVEVVQKFLKNIKETMDHLTKAGAPIHTSLIDESSILNRFLPQQLTREVIKMIAESMKDKGMPGIMKHLKETYAGQYDGKLASEVVKEVLAG